MPINISTPEAVLVETRQDIDLTMFDIHQDSAVVSVSFQLMIKDVLDTTFVCFLPMSLTKRMVSKLEGDSDESIVEPTMVSAPEMQPQMQQQMQPEMQPQMQQQMQSEMQPQMQQQMQPQMQQQMQPQMQPQTQQQMQPQMQQQMQPQMQQQMQPDMQQQMQQMQQPYMQGQDRQAMQFEGQYQQPDGINQQMMQQANGGYPPYGQMQQPYMQQYPYGQMPYPQAPYPYPPQPRTPNTPAMMEVKNAEFPDFSKQAMYAGTPSGSNMGLLMGVQLEVSVVIGRTKQKIKDIMEFGQGSVIELDKQTGAPAEIVVNGKLLAYGDVIVVGDNFGVRITEIVGTKELLDSLGNNT